MNKKVLSGLIILLAVSVGLVVVGINRIIHPAFSTLGLVILPIGIWIYLVWIVRKRKEGVFSDRMEPEAAAKRLKTLRRFLLTGGISFVVAIISAILHNVVFMLFMRFAGEDFWERTGMEDEPVFFIITLLAVLAWILSTIGSLVIYILGRRKPALSSE